MCSTADCYQLMFNLNELKKETTNDNRYERRLSKLVSQGQEVVRIGAFLNQ